MSYPKIDYWEGNVPLKLLEYIAMKKFVLCTDLNSFKRMAGSYPRIIFINDNKPQSIKEGIIRYIKLKDSVDSNFDVTAIIERYSWKSIACDFKNFLENL
jgi:glycosyltransferase involved in cell wall biosynthesis